VAHILKRHGLEAARHYALAKLGVKKQAHTDFDPAEADRLLPQLLADLAQLDGASPDRSAAAKPEQRSEFRSPSSPAVYNENNCETSGPNVSSGTAGVR